MPSSLSEVSALLDAAGIRHGKNEERIRTGFETDIYEDQHGDNCLNLIIRIEDDHDLLRILAPEAYRLPPKAGARKLAAVLRTINQLNWETKLTQYEMDTIDGEIRLNLNLPLEDAKLTEKQLVRAVRLMPTIADLGHVHLRRAIEEGVAMPNEVELVRRFDTYIKARA